MDRSTLDVCNEECRWACKNDETGENFNVVQFGNRCTKGTMGYLCNECVEGYYKIASVCEVCPDNTWLLILLAIFGAVFAGFAFWLLDRYNVNIAIINIFIDFAQVIAIFVHTNVPWPSELRKLFEMLSIFNFNIVELLGIECSVEITYSDKFYLYQSAPLILLGFCLVAYVVLKLFLCCPSKVKGCVLKLFPRFEPDYAADSVIGSYLIMFNLIYLSICRSALDVFNCKEPTPPDGHSYMESTHDRCNEPGGLHMQLKPIAITALLVYCIGFPIALAVALHMNKEDIAKDMELRATQEHHQRRQASFYPKSIRFGRFYKYFHPSCSQWNVMIMLRKFFVASTALLFRDNATFQLSFALMGLFGLFVLQMIYRPYWSVEEMKEYADLVHERDNNPHLANINLQQVQMRHVGIGTNSRKVMNGMGVKDAQHRKEMDKLVHEERSQVLSNAKSVLFNLNTIESTMLVNVIFINLSAIMLLSRQYEESDGLDKFVTYLVILAIVSCLTLLSAALVREIIIARRLSKGMAGAKWRAAIRKVAAQNKKDKAHAERFQDVVFQMMRRNKIGNFRTESSRRVRSKKRGGPPRNLFSRGGQRQRKDNAVTPAEPRRISEVRREEEANENKLKVINDTEKKKNAFKTEEKLAKRKFHMTNRLLLQAGDKREDVELSEL